MVPEREVKHIERHVQRGGQVRGSKNKACRQLPRPPSETTFPKIVPEERGVLSAQRRKHVSEREQMQIKDHQERMVRGRELVEQVANRAENPETSRPVRRRGRKIPAQVPSEIMSIFRERGEGWGSRDNRDLPGRGGGTAHGWGDSKSPGWVTLLAQWEAVENRALGAFL